MHEVTNISETTQRFNARDPKTGAMVLVRLKPGEGGLFAVDLRQKRFQSGALRIGPPPQPKPVARTRTRTRAKPAPDA